MLFKMYSISSACSYISLPSFMIYISYVINSRVISPAIEFSLELCCAVLCCVIRLRMEGGRDGGREEGLLLV